MRTTAENYLPIALILGMWLALTSDSLSAAPPQTTTLSQPPADARLAFEEDWSSGKIDGEKWYVLRKKWGDGNHGVVPDNVRIEKDIVSGKRQNVLVCEAHGDQYDGPTIGLDGKKNRVGGVIVSKPHFGSGRFEVVMKVGDREPQSDGPENPRLPIGTVPAIWTYGYRMAKGDLDNKEQFAKDNPLYNPHMPAYGMAINEYWSEIDFPEFGKDGDFGKALYNTFCQNRHDTHSLDVTGAADGGYHTFVTEWRTRLKPLEGVTDNQVVKHLGYWWIKDKSIPFADYLGNPLKQLGKDEYAVCWGDKAIHWIDGRKVGENTKFVPVMASQLNLGVWLPKWAGPAPWKVSRATFASIKVWQYDDAGDVRGVLVDDISNNFDARGVEIP